MPGQPLGVECTVGFSLEVLEGDTWYPAQVVEVGDQRVKVRVDNWGDSSDQWLPAFSKKLRMRGAHARECRINWVKSTLVASVGEAAGVSLAQAGAAPAALPSVRQPGDGAAVTTSPREAAGQSAPARGLTRSSPRLRGIGRSPLAAEIERSAVASRPPRGLLGIRSSPRRGSSRPPPHPSPAAASSAAGAPRHCPRSSMRLPQQPNNHPDSQRLSHQLEYQWVGRHLQIRILNELICGPPTTAVFVHGPPATGKSAILNDLLDGGWYDGWGPLNGGDAERHQVVKIDCVECSSQRALLDTILNQLPRTDHPSAPQLGSDTNSSTNSTNTYRSLSGSGTSTGSNRRAAGTSWVRGERGIPQLLDALREVCYRRGNRITMIFDRAERLRELEPRLLSSILRLNELLACAHGQRGLSDFNWHTCGADDLFRRDSLDPGVLVVLVSENEWRTFRDTGFGTGVVEPTIVSFPAYSKEELIIILEKKWRDVHDAASAAESQILRKFLRLMLDVLCPVCRDLLELQRLLFEMLPKVASAMERETSLAESTDVALRSCAAGGMYPELHSVARPILGEAQQNFFSVGGTVPIGPTSSNGSGAAPSLAAADRSSRSSTVFDLPLYSKYLRALPILSIDNVDVQGVTCAPAQWLRHIWRPIPTQRMTSFSSRGLG